MRVVRGPKENRHRPAIDPLFRSAARSYGTRTVGIVLSGMLDDGTAGLMAIKRRGGLAIVQRPSEALYPSMPQSALNHVHVDYCLPIDEIGPLLVSLTREPGGEQEVGLSADALEKEVWTAEMGTDASDGQEHVGQPSVFSCPECGGVLWEIKDGNFLRFRCRVGHALSAESMLAEQTEAVDKALWNAFKTLEEQVSLTRQLAQRAQAQKNSHLAQRFLMRARKVEEDARQLRQILLNTPAQEQVSELQEQEKPEEAAE
jgi:two-component system chemotaxis response regulator CheB